MAVRPRDFGPPEHDEHEEELAGIDALELPIAARHGRMARLWQATWPLASAIGVLLTAWAVLVGTGWKPAWVLPPPGAVFRRLATDIADGTLVRATVVTMGRAALGFTLALVIGGTIGLAVAARPHLRRAVGTLITGLQTMPSIAWFPLAILLFQLSEEAILLVVVLGGAPAIANGIIAGVDRIPPILLRAGKALGARGVATYRHIILPGALPGFVGGMQQGWAFAWRSLMAGELLVIIANRPSLGVRLQMAREVSDAEGLVAGMIAVLVVGILVDALVFRRLDRAVRQRCGLVDEAA